MADRKLQYARAYPDGQLAIINEAAGTPIPFTASTPGVKRDGLDLRAGGWRVDRYRLNPVFLWCHDYTRPSIGTGDATVEPARLFIPVTFDQEDQFARQVESKYRRGIMRAVSVGWDFVDATGGQLDWWRLTPEQIRDETYYDLTELSAVPVPADPEALAERQRSALRSISREFAHLFDEQEREGSDVLAVDIQAAVRAEVERMGIDVNLLAQLRAERAAIPPHDTPVVDEPWDGPAAVSACPAERAALRAIHAWVDAEGDPDVKSSYKFPHHAAPGEAANLPACRNALARLAQEATDIPEADKPGVERHLRNHLDAEQQQKDHGGETRGDDIDQAAARAVLDAFGNI